MQSTELNARIVRANDLAHRFFQPDREKMHNPRVLKIHAVANNQFLFDTNDQTLAVFPRRLTNFA